MLVPTSTDLEAAIQRAKTAFLHLYGLMAAHRLDFQVLTLLLEIPPYLTLAYEEYAARVNDVVRIMVAQAGIPPGTKLSTADRHRFTLLAAEAVMS